MAKPHAETGDKIKFCCTRGQPCKCDEANNYKVLGKPKPAWNSPGPAPKPLYYEAHHVLCCASVRKCLNDKRGITAIVRETPWCINKERNMIALPLWGDTIKWYTYTFKRYPVAPPFKNRPQHNWDHNGRQSYRTDVEKSLSRLAATIAKGSKQAHKKRKTQIASSLNRLAGSFRRELVARGQGTHRQLTSEKLSPTWYAPFSMCDEPTEKGRIKRETSFDRIRDKVRSLLGG